MYADMPSLVDAPPFIPPPMGAANGGQPGDNGFLSAFPGAARSGPSTPYWPAQATPYSASGPGPAGWPTTPTTPHSYTPAFAPPSAASWSFGGAQPAPPTMGGYVPWVGGGSSPGESWGPRTPAESVHSPWSAPAAAGWGSWGDQPITPSYFGNEVDGNGFPRERERKRSASRHRRNSSAGRARFALAFGDDESDDWTHVSHPGEGLRRSNSQSAAAASFRPPRVSPHATPMHMHRSVSWGNEPQQHIMAAYHAAGMNASLPAYMQGDVYDEHNLAKRPRDWRADYVPRQSIGAGLASLLSKGRSDVRDFSDPVKRTLALHLLYQPSQPPFYWDMTTAPFEASPIQFNLNRPLNSLDMAQLALQPATSNMRLYHPRLPWYIDIVARHTNGITVADVFEQMHRQLHTPILGRHFWNDELGEEERGEITRAFVRRCRGRAEVVQRGVVQLDFLGRKVIFEGLVRGARGMWEMRMSKKNEQGV
ncbi:hypothetical protein CVT24_004700 [Panaeolus cyanescens]|uniref:DUF6699 domain-containing protein n=1 Tax=Panaeolus cyanescens TaxID=181874 RepID=A0A409YSQ2_9AGAR|nr:hypothetical protein CVT24_004700 [Panaeolus cyanescens]